MKKVKLLCTFGWCSHPCQFAVISSHKVFLKTLLHRIFFFFLSFSRAVKISSSLSPHLSHRGQSNNPFPLNSTGKRFNYGSKLNPYTRSRMTEAWQQHAVAPPPVVHTIPPGADTLGCTVYGIVLQPDTALQQQQQQQQQSQQQQQQQQQQQHHSQQHNQQQHPAQAQQPSLHVGSEGGHKCGACGHDISHLANPHEHQCMVSQDRSFQCTQCLKIFHQATDLLEHQCVQVEQKPFVCGVCKMGFSLLTSLAQHHNAHNNGSPWSVPYVKKHIGRVLEMPRQLRQRPLQGNLPTTKRRPVAVLPSGHQASLHSSLRNLTGPTSVRCAPRASVTYLSSPVMNVSTRARSLLNVKHATKASASPLI